MSYQTYMPECKDHIQTDMLAEFSGKDGKKQTLIDVEKEKAKLANKPLPGQLELKRGPKRNKPKQGRK